jgi:hypothetical protein
LQAIRNVAREAAKAGMWIKTICDTDRIGIASYPDGAWSHSSLTMALLFMTFLPAGLPHYPHG